METSKKELIVELSAIVRNSSVIENDLIARRTYKLFKKIYDIIPIITVKKITFIYFNSYGGFLMFDNEIKNNK